MEVAAHRRRALLTSSAWVQRQRHGFSQRLMDLEPTGVCVHYEPR